MLIQGRQARAAGRLAEARSSFAEAIASSRKCDDSAALANALVGLGQVERDLHQSDDALKHYEEAAAIYRTLNAQLDFAHTVRHLGDILRNQGRLDLAAAKYEETLAIYRREQGTHTLDLANAIRGYALLQGQAGNLGDAKRLWQEARNLYAQVEVQAGIDESDKQISRLTSA